MSQEELNSIKSSIDVHAKHRSCKTLHGLNFDSAKSALQKSIRRGRGEDAARYAMEMWLMVAAPEITQAKAKVTNLINRLHVIMSEDVGIGSPYMPLVLEPMFSIVESYKTRGGVQGLVSILTIAMSLARCPHSRMVSLLNTAYFNRKIGDTIKKKYPTLLEESARQMAPLDGLRNRLTHGSYEAAFFAGEIVHTNAEVKISELKQVTKVFKVKKGNAPSSFLVWEQLLASTQGEAHNNVVTLLKVFKNRQGNEEHVYLLHALLIALLSNSRFPNKTEIRPVLVSVSAQQALDLLRNHIVTTLNIPAVYLNMHTAEGKAKGLKKGTLQGHEQWLREGIMLKDSVDSNIRQAAQYQTMYENIKRNIREVPRQKRPRAPAARPDTRLARCAVSDVPRMQRLAGDMKDKVQWRDLHNVQCCQLQTCGGKPMTFKGVLGQRSIIFKKAADGGRVQLLADRLKPLFGLESMQATRFVGNFDTRKLDSTKPWEPGHNWEHFYSPDVMYLCFKESAGRPLAQVQDWKSNPAITREYLTIAMFRYGTFRFTDFNPRNVMLLDTGRLLSIDEMDVGRSSICGKVPPTYLKAAMQQHQEYLEHLAVRWSTIQREVFKGAAEAVGFHPDIGVEIKKNLLELPQVWKNELRQAHQNTA